MYNLISTTVAFEQNKLYSKLLYILALFSKRSGRILARFAYTGGVLLTKGVNNNM